jgi:carboxylesterase type B
VFGSLAPDQWPPDADAISDLMQGYWSQFPRTGDPNAGDAPEWVAFRTADGNRLNIDLEPNMVDALRAEPCALWRDYYETLFE